MSPENHFSPNIILSIFLLLGLITGPAHADVAPGDVIDRSNHAKIEGLVPDFIHQWVRDGDLVMKIGEQRFDPGAFWPKEVRENREANQGRYAIGENNALIDKTTGKPARGVKGLPFPVLDPEDPDMPVQLMWNDVLIEFFLQGDVSEIHHWLSVTRRGLEKTLVLDNMTRRFDPEKSDHDYGQLTVFRQPFSIAGTGTLAIYFLDPMKDGVRYAYTPELRRVKRLSHRVSGSDNHFGLDNSPDDSWAGGPKTNIEEGSYRYIGERDALVPYFSEKPRTLERNDKGELPTGFGGTGLKMRFGFDDPAWTGAPWHILDIVWVKTRVYVIESKSKSPGYAYGPCEGWIEKGSMLHVYKRITDAGGKLWKGVYWPGMAMETRDGEFRLINNWGWIEVDMRRDHGTASCNGFREGTYRRLFADVDKNLFTRGGFIKFYK